MASSGKAVPASLAERVRDRLGVHVNRGDRLCVGYSGGLDSSVLLHLLASCRDSLGVGLEAVHVHHGRSALADDWVVHCQATCQDLGVSLRVARVKVEPDGRGWEAAARHARYDIFRAQPADFLVLAHHADDQAETVLLNLLRGAGTRGLAGMPEARSLGGGGPTLLRPLLEVSRQSLLQYAQQHGLTWMEDDSNLDTRFRRNHLRHQWLPALEPHFPGCRQALGRLARHMSATEVLLDDLARLDLGSPEDMDNKGLDLARLRPLTAPRAANLLRYSLRLMGVGPVPAAALDELHGQLTRVLDTADPDTSITWRCGEHTLRVWHGHLHRLPAPALPMAMPWRGEASLDFAGGLLLMHWATGQGLDKGLLSGPLSFRGRTGGERLQTDPGRPRRALKKILREAGLPPWERQGLPLLYAGETLAWVARVGPDAAYRCPPDQIGLVIEWHPPPRP